jgi:hypothetical protein
MVGVAILMYGVSKLLRVLKLNKLFSGKKESDEQTYIKQEKPQETPWQSFGGGQVKDVDYEKVDEQ